MAPYLPELFTTLQALLTRKFVSLYCGHKDKPITKQHLIATFPRSPEYYLSKWCNVIYIYIPRNMHTVLLCFVVYTLITILLKWTKTSICQRVKEVLQRNMGELDQYQPTHENYERYCATCNTLLKFRNFCDVLNVAQYCSRDLTFRKSVGNVL